jgi:predicted permease
LLYTIALAVVSTVVFGLAPALHGTRTAGFGRVRLSLRNLLLAVQVALSVVLLIGAGLLLRGVQHAQTMAPGFAVNDVGVVSFELPASSYGTTQTRNFVSELNQSLANSAYPSYGFTLIAPLGRGRWWTSCRLPREPKTSDKLMMMLEVSKGYFDVLRIPILAGRNFEAADDGRKTALVNEALARRYWPGENAVGKVLLTNQEARQIVGVVKDAYTSSLDHIEPMFYTPISGHWVPEMVVRNPSGKSDVKLLATLVSRIEPRCRVSVDSLQANLDRSLAPARIGSMLAGVLGLLALALANIGLFGVFAYVVEQRTHELGIRMALGAHWTQVVRVALGDSTRAIAIGLLAGFGLAVVVSRLMREYLYGLPTLDPVAYAVVMVTLVVAGLTATFVPARRVAKIDPMRALHYE